MDKYLDYSGLTYYDGVLKGYMQQILNTLIPIGSITMWSTPNPPAGWVICDGRSITGDTYAALRTVLGTDVVPDLRGRFPLGAGDSGEHGSTGHTIGETGGEEKHYLSLNEMKRHSPYYSLIFSYLSRLIFAFNKNRIKQ